VEVKPRQRIHGVVVFIRGIRDEHQIQVEIKHEDEVHPRWRSVESAQLVPIELQRIEIKQAKDFDPDIGR
jgi:hypothetical protein